MTPEQFQSAREQLGYSVTRMAREIGVTDRNVYRWLSGEQKIPPTVERLIALMLRYRKKVRP